MKIDNGHGNQKVGWHPTDQTFEQITEWVADGETIVSICARFGISKQWFYKAMESNSSRFCDENGNNKLKAAVALGRAAAAEPIMNIIYTKAIDADHREQLRAGMWYLEKVAGMGREPQVIVINEKGETIDKSPEEMAALLKANRPTLQSVDK